MSTDLPDVRPPPGVDRQVTFAAHGHLLTNANVWSPDGRRVVYDVRSDADGSTFDGDWIESVDVDAGRVRCLYRAARGAKCGVATYHPKVGRVVFILGPENPDATWTYGPDRRQGVTVDEPASDEVADGEGPASHATNLDARDLTPPFTAGALRGGSHVHTFSPDGAMVSFTYDDHVLAGTPAAQRNVGVSLIGRPVTASPGHLRNHDGSAFSVLVTRTTADPTPGTDAYGRAYEDAWVGMDGYARRDGTRQRRAIAFLGDVAGPGGRAVAEVFVADLPDDWITADGRPNPAAGPKPGDGPLAGTPTRLPFPPAGVVVRRLTRTTDRRYPGAAGPRHWVRSSPDGSRIGVLMKDDAGVAQLHVVSPATGDLRQVTRGPNGIASAFTWSPDGRNVAHVMDRSVCVTNVETGQTRRLTARSADEADTPLPLGCVFCPDGRRVAYLRRVPHGGGVERYNQVFVVAATENR